MKVIIAPDSFKGTLSSPQAAELMKKGVLRAIPDAQCVLMPMADGGEGTFEVLTNAFPNSKTIYVESVTPLGVPIRVQCSLINAKTGVLDVATASGFSLIDATDRTTKQARAASSYGTGLLFAALLDAGVEEVYMGLGGSATTDGGYGLLGALGATYFDSEGNLLDPMDASQLAVLRRIETSGLHRRLSHVNVHLLCDVFNPLCGPTGAAHTFGPQKGLNPEGILVRDAELARFATLLEETFGLNELLATQNGSGAAGGMGIALMATAKAKVQAGAKVVADLIRLSDAIQEADVVITGEGKVDGQTFHGKAPQYIASLATQANKPALLVAGRLGAEPDAVFKMGFSHVVEAAHQGATQEEISQNAAAWVQEATYVMMTDYVNRK